ncbi:replication initiation factor domain-containing protein [uncultured Desulfuromonas sp.]|uniref:replication initiation factor domain-containing protein n=1 Tax=uncultured Desulfuromonas sp. TaxID=181013 RepID=UPI002AABB883|nr:replication initiation factor domain-containing protein [uncultured Desulfuromonas sp.]
MSSVSPRSKHVNRIARVTPLDQSPCVQTPLLTAHRTCNTGALIPKHNSFKIDWLEMTVSGVDWSDFCKFYLGLDPDLFVLEEFGRHGYADLRTYGNVQLCYTSGRLDRGVKVILPSSALDQVSVDACEIIRRGVEDGASFARIDIAFDDYTGSYSYETLQESILSPEAQELVCRFREVRPQEPVWLQGQRKGLRMGEGFVFGSGSSSRVCVIYNKRLEQEAKAIKAKEPLPDFPEDFTWWRVECRWKKAAALVLAAHIAENGLFQAGALIRGVIDFREPADGDDHHTERRPVSSWWNFILSSADIIKTGITKPVKTIEEKCQWLSTSVKKVIGQVCSIMGPDVVSAIARDGAEATTEKEWKRLRATYRPPGRIRPDLALGIPF